GITVRVKVSGFATVPLEVKLLEAGGDRPVAVGRLWTDRNVAVLTSRLDWTPRESAAPDANAAADIVRRLRVLIDPNPAEVTGEDNHTELHVLVTEPRIRVLYVEGTMRPEYKYLKRLLSSDPNIRFMSLVRITGNRFWSQGDLGGVKLDRLPRTDADFDLFDVLIIGDLDRTFLTSGQMARIGRFVNDGGGLLMLGGHNSFGPGGYGGTEIEAVLPVRVGSRAMPQETTPFVPQLTAAGEAHPIFEGLAGFFSGPGGRKPDPKLPKLPSLQGCVTVADVKPAAALLALHPTRRYRGKPLVVLAVERFGAGRSAAFTADTTWTWYLPMRGMGRKSPYARFWGQLLRWLANVKTKSRQTRPCVAMRLDKTYVRIGQGPVKVLARVQDEKGRPAADAQVACSAVPLGGGKAENFTLSPRMGDRLFQGEFRPSRPGKYTLKVTALDSAGAALGTDELTLTVAAFSKETDRLARNDALLQLLADRTDGRKVDIAGLPDLVDQIIRRQQARARLDGRAAEGRIVRLFDFPLLFVAFVALLTGEWILRRRWHLR
ncbi:MAG: hypothetical protein J7M21_01800, partial [Planctomycetes bacterium]|nr:hypothetical protein [Planctomycetota bacterium]